MPNVMCDDANMRTTVTIDPDLAAKLRRLARERGISLAEAINTTLRAGMGERAGTARPYRVPARRLGLRPGIDLDESLHLAAAFQDQETTRGLGQRN
jgi:Arc/MetJ family transcription regulator